MSKITVLVAVYNAEQYLRKCLDSLREQTLSDIQVVCVNDCSTDGSLSIIEEYTQKDNRFHLINMPVNQGQAVARNKGLEIANGEYIAMLDSDDWFAPDSLQKAYEAVTSQSDTDCAVFRLMQCYEDSGTVEEYQNKTTKTILSGEEAFRLSLDWSLHGLYIIRSDIHKQYPYDTSCRLYSDDNTTRLHYLHSRKVIISDGQYFYRKHPESMTNSCSMLRFDYMDANLSMKRQLIAEISKGNISNPDAILNFYEQHRWLNIVGAYWYYYQHKNQFTPIERRTIKHRITAMLQTIEKERIAPSLRWKFGYYPFKSFRLFALIEDTYFLLRSLLQH